MRRSVPARAAALLLLGFALILSPRWSVPVLAATATVHIGDTLNPASLQITPGTSVTWINDSGDRHRVRTTSGPTEFDSGDLDPGESFTVTFNGTGTWQYRDDRNPNLSNYWGTVTSANTPTPTPKPTSTPPPGSTPVPTPPPPPGDILMAGRAFSPPTLTIDPGTTVRWRNNDSREHTVTANNSAFNSGIMPVGATFSRTFTTSGTFAYLCQIHPDMTGTITVRTASGATPPPTPAPTPTPKPTPVPTAPPAGSGQVQIVDFAFNASTIDIAAGTTVTWVNNGAALHTVTANDGSFDSGLLSAGTGKFSRRFSTPGTFPYVCSLHPSMTGVVRVSGANGATPPPPAPPTPKPTKPPVAAGELELRDFAFTPSAISISPGTTITWVNTGVAPHTVTDRAGAFDSGILNPGARYTRTFSTPGTFQLLCSIHPDMHATLTVSAPGQTAPPPATPKPVVTPPPGSGGVSIIDFDFAPKVVQVPVGTTVKWSNTGVAPHTVTAKDGSFDSGFLNTGETYSRQFTEAGTYEYLCAIHPAMLGTVVVGDVPPAPGGSQAPGVGASPGAPGSPGGSAAPSGTTEGASGSGAAAGPTSPPAAGPGAAASGGPVLAAAGTVLGGGPDGLTGELGLWLALIGVVALVGTPFVVLVARFGSRSG